jgi:hypothetical protein
MTLPDTTGNSSQHGIDLKSMLMLSDRVRRSLAKICQVKTLRLEQSESLMTYCYDEEMLLELLIEKHNKIKKFLA